MAGNQKGIEWEFIGFDPGQCPDSLCCYLVAMENREKLLEDCFKMLSIPKSVMIGDRSFDNG